jgi:hypothetical protein
MANYHRTITDDGITPDAMDFIGVTPTKVMVAEAKYNPPSDPPRPRPDRWEWVKRASWIGSIIASALTIARQLGLFFRRQPVQRTA